MCVVKKKSNNHPEAMTPLAGDEPLLAIVVMPWYRSSLVSDHYRAGSPDSAPGDSAELESRSTYSVPRY